MKNGMKLMSIKSYVNYEVKTMTEKRFRVGVDSNNGVGLFDGSIRLSFIRFNNKEAAVSCENALMYHCNLMNELNDENEQLKQSLDYYKKIDVHSERTELKRNNLVLKTSLKEVMEENEELKRALRDYHNAFDCSQCIHHNYDWYDDGDEFEVCDKGNDEAQMEYHSCRDWEEL